MKKQLPTNIDTIVIHCSDIEWGNVSSYRELHRSFGWEDIGYHYVILNSYPTEDLYCNQTPDFASDGKIEQGRQECFWGAHVKNHNENSIGICLVGQKVFSKSQFESLLHLINSLKKKFSITKIRAHYEYDTAKEQGKSCPNINIDYLRELIIKNN